MSDPTKIRAKASGAVTTVRMLMAHEMETGQRQDADGKTIAAWHITEVTVFLNGRAVMTAQWGPAVAKDPYLQFNLRGAKTGDKITIAWLDNRGERRSDEAVVD